MKFDEESHNTDEYCSSEKKRIIQLMQDVEMRPIVMIRFNLDANTNIPEREVTVEHLYYNGFM
jgi:hypothetical protein